MARQVSDRVFSECHGFVSQSVFVKVVLRQLRDGSDPVFAAVFETVEALLKIPTPLLFCQLGYRFGSRLCRLSDSPAREIEFVPPDPAPLEQRHVNSMPSFPA